MSTDPRAHHGGQRDVEQLDPTPMEMPLGARMPESLQDTIARMVRVAVQEETNEELESWDEANDFTEDDPDVLDFSPYEFDDLEQEGNPFIEMKDAPEPTDEPDEPPKGESTSTDEESRTEDSG